MKWMMTIRYDFKRLASLVLLAIIVLFIWGYVLWSVEQYHDAYENSVPETESVDHINTENI